MDTKNDALAENQKEGLADKKITRKEAIKKGGFAALSAATMMVLVSNKANACHPVCSPKTGSGSCNDNKKSFYSYQAKQPKSKKGGSHGNSSRGGGNRGNGWR